MIASFGGKLSGARLERARRSPQWREDRFQNPIPTRTLIPGSARAMLRQRLWGEQVRAPRRAVPVESRTAPDFDRRPATGLRATWMGHATVLLEIDGLRVLTDPVWSARVSPASFAGPKRFFDPPIALGELPPVDAILISHDHYDHLDMATAKALGAGGAAFLVPLGVGAHLEAWGVPGERIRELDWGEQALLDSATFTMTPARHFSGRRLTDEGRTLWSSWVVASPRHRVFVCGDSGFFGGFREIGENHGPFDLTLISAGAYSSLWPMIHMTPEEVVRAHVDLRGELLLPIHWGTFNLAFHDWNEPAVRVSASAAERGVRAIFPRPGEMVEPARASDLPGVEWWREP